ncbi:hypothetical protein [Nocardia niigatensis]|uniref:hypothetical protein n=1 Tax=Nocardia niigatensis TaxID=209249 RepID=UPI000A06D2E1|nr:hypothetical protein [Nocardia niigatensis]
MFARSSTIQAQLSSMDAGIAYMRDDVMSELSDIPGWVGMSLLVDRSSGRCIVTTAWETEQALHDSSSRVRSIRDRAAQMFGSDGSTLVEEWEIAALHRNHHASEGSCVRAAWVRNAPERLDAAIELYKSAALPGMEELDGFCSASLMVDRSSGRGVSCVTFDNAEAMARNADRSADMRASIAGRTGSEVTEVREFELALAHLRVPELV